MSRVRVLLVLGVAAPFVALSIYDACHGRYRTAVLAMLFAVSNVLIYW